MRIGKMTDEWHAHKRAQYASGRLAPSSIAAIEDRLRLVEPIRGVRVNKLNTESYLASLPGSYPSRVRSVLAQAADHARLNPNPFRGVSTPSKVNRVKAVPSLDEVHALAALCGPYEPLVLGLAGSGMRYGEAVALEPRHVVGRQVIVEQALDPITHMVRGTKTGNVRRLLVAGFAASAFEAPAFEGSAYQFSRAKPLANTQFHADAWQAAKRQLGLTWRVHDLRHFYATHCLAQGVPVATVAAWLGHSSALTTLKVYAGWCEDDFSNYEGRV